MTRKNGVLREMKVDGLAYNIGQVWGAVTVLAAIFALAWFILAELIK